MAIAFNLTPEQIQLKQAARDFAHSEIQPITQKLNESNDPNIAPWKLCKDMFHKGVDLGFTSLLLPQEYGGKGRKCIDAALVLEELGAVDVSVACSYFNLTAAMPLLLLRAGTSEQQRLSDVSSGEPLLFSAAESEPNIATSDLFCPIPDPQIGLKTVAVRDGDTYILNGNKSSLVTNAGIADAYFIIARTALDLPLRESLSIFYVKADTPGLTFGKRTEMIGWKASHHAAIHLDNVRVPADNLIGGQEGQAGFQLMLLPEVAIGLAASYVGLARAAYEYALNYAKQRVSWGRPLIEHQAVALKLADMMVDTQAARMLVWDAACAADTDPQLAATIKAPAAKTYAVDVAIKNAEKAVEILGGYGVTKENQAGKFLADAWIGYSCDFSRDILRLGLVNFM